MATCKPGVVPDVLEDDLNGKIREYEIEAMSYFGLEIDDMRKRFLSFEEENEGLSAKARQFNLFSLFLEWTNRGK